MHHGDAGPGGESDLKGVKPNEISPNDNHDGIIAEKAPQRPSSPGTSDSDALQTVPLVAPFVDVRSEEISDPSRLELASSQGTGASQQLERYGTDAGSLRLERDLRPRRREAKLKAEKL